MTTKIGNVITIESEGRQQCDFCGAIAELRPYGPKGECICYDCGNKNQRATSRQMFSRLFGVELSEQEVDRFVDENPM